jgi:hypothetical protein
MPLRFSTGCVDSYSPCKLGPNLHHCIAEGRAFQAWYRLAGFELLSHWENQDVWATDFRDGSRGRAAPNDLAPDGGTDVVDIYYYSGHGSCQRSPTSTDPDFLVVCDESQNLWITIGSECRWGEPMGRLRFLFLDASCPMDLVSLRQDWFPCFGGLHLAVGHSGTTDADTEDSFDRGNWFAALTCGYPLPLFGGDFSVGDAWMRAGTMDIQSGCSAVIIANGVSKDDARDRVFNERVRDGRADPHGDWFWWRWVTED